MLPRRGILAWHDPVACVLRYSEEHSNNHNTLVVAKRRKTRPVHRATIATTQARTVCACQPLISQSLYMQTITTITQARNAHTHARNARTHATRARKHVGYTTIVLLPSVIRPVQPAMLTQLLREHHIAALGGPMEHRQSTDRAPTEHR